jgi:hypothetical protein
MSKHYKTTCVWNCKTYSSRTFQQYQELGGGGGGGSPHEKKKKKTTKLPSSIDRFAYNLMVECANQQRTTTLLHFN